MVHKNIHRTVLIRLDLAWLILSLALGALVFYLEMEKSDALVLDLSLPESRSFTEHLGQDDLIHLAQLKQKADDFLKSGFISVRVYDTTQRQILEVVEPGADEARLGITPHVHSLSPGDFSHYHTYWTGVSRSCRCCCR